jgi:hypothetical protein
LVQTIQIFGEDPIHLGRDVEVTKENLVSIVSDLKPEAAAQLEGVEYSLRIEGLLAVVYRVGAEMG